MQQLSQHLDMNHPSSLNFRMSNAEKTMRRDLAACYRLIALYGWDELIGSHISARVPGEDAFLLNPFGLMFEEVTASNLVKYDASGNLLQASEWGINPAGFVIHSAIHEARPEVACVMHLHGKDGTAVSCVEPGLLPLNQTAMLVSQDIAYHDFEGVALDESERERLGKDLGSKNLMLLRNHGTIAVGDSIAQCFVGMWYFEWACSVQVKALSMGLPLNKVSDASINSVGRFRSSDIGKRLAELSWQAMLRKVERECPDFDQ